MDNGEFLEQIRSVLNVNGDPWLAGVTSLTSLPFDVKKQYLGATPPPGVLSIDEIEQRVLLMKESFKAEALAVVRDIAAYDLRNVNGKNYVTPIKNQKGCGSCVAFGTIATMESTLRMQHNDPDYPVDLSEAHLFFCLGNAVGFNASCQNGWWPHIALDRIQNNGIYGESWLNYDEALSRADRCSGFDLNPKYFVKITGYEEITGKSAQIKEWINSKGPVIACFIVYDDFYSYTSGIYRHVTGERHDGHCVTIVGYNDDEGYWICKNSWGLDWGEEGFFRIAYGECAIDSWGNYGVTGIEIVTIEPVPVPDPDECTEYDCPPSH